MIHVTRRSNRTRGKVEEAKILMSQEEHRIFLDELHNLHGKLRKERFIIPIKETVVPGGSTVVNEDSHHSFRQSAVFRKHC